MSLEWTESLSVGVDIIDGQHKELFRRFGDLIDACHEGHGKERIAELLGFLDDYVVFHFGEEEKLMQNYGYPDIESHRHEHATFVHRLQYLKQVFHAEGPTQTLVSKTVRILLNWIVKHIKSVDLELGAFLKPRLAAG
jgi:hemerythrin